ncbi:uncharacterized protein TNCT_402211 [Trichonephila clavata]|uniref:Uncharacterized protein n=1 Tax=Trichonephila clavata TaxID=2740835 RepID=A0A8X6L9T2_TRICU|nr:uncharacterized protein TNCT_402211 [Trichonephila clavata]
MDQARKRLPIFKRLAGAKWGCGRAILNITYKTYDQPVLNYCNEVLFTASNKVLGMLDVFQNQALRLIPGGVKTTLVLVMHLLCNLKPMTNLVGKNAAILYNRLTGLPNISFWREYDFNRSRNLKTQCIREIAQYNAINDEDL